jgi:predicted GNAT family N-acyltransferase
MPELIVVRAEECLPLRESVLRPGQPAAAWTYALDGEPRAIHFALKEKQAVVGVATVLPEAREDGGRELWRLRGMAVLESRRGRGFGRTLLAATQAVVKQRGGGVWCTARTSVEDFYLRYGFVREGDEFEVDGAGPHVLMTWNPERGRGVPADRREEHARIAGDADAGDAGDEGDAGGGGHGGTEDEAADGADRGGLDETGDGDADGLGAGDSVDDEGRPLGD